MQNTDQSGFVQGQWQRSLTRRFFHWLFSWRVIRGFLIGLATLVTLLVLAITIENWRGARAWRNYQAELAVQGETTDFRQFIPPPVPDEQNFAMTPLLRPLFDYTNTGKGTEWRGPEAKDRVSNITPYLDVERSGVTLGSYEQNTLIDLNAWQEAFRGNTNFPPLAQPQSAAADVLLVLSKFDRELAELREASQRPYARFPMEYLKDDPFSILLPHLAALKAPPTALALRATALLELGRSQAALEDVQLGFRIADSIQHEPILISHLVRIAILAVTLQPVREGLVRHAWSETQLVELEKTIGAIDLLSEYERVMRGERAWSLAGLDYFHTRGWRKGESFLGEGPSRAMSLVPSGWVAQNKLTITRLHQDYYLAAVDDQAHRVFPELARGMEKKFEHMKITPYNIFAKLLLPALGRVCQRSARAQTLLDHTRLACALERYRLAHGGFPESLDALVPRFVETLPPDILTGDPLHYRRIAEDKYVLYSVGWNQTDDGGDIVFRDRKERNVDLEKGDWVWRYPLE